MIHCCHKDAERVTVVFIKTTKVRDSEYIKLVESYREQGKTKHRVLFNFGRADLIRKDESFLKIVKRLCEIAHIPLASGCRSEEGAFLDNCGEAELYNYGYLAYLKLWKELGFRIASKKPKTAPKSPIPCRKQYFLWRFNTCWSP